MSSILIVGGGIIGLSIARELHKQGADKITILECGKIGNEASLAAAGMLAPQAEADQANHFFRFCSESKSLYPNLAEELLEETGIDIELDQTGTIYIAFNSRDSAEIQNRLKWQKSAGLEVEYLTASETHKLEPFVSPDLIESLFFPNDWQIENKKLIKALHKYAQISDIEIVENTSVLDFVANGNNITNAITSNGAEYFADHFVIAAGAWSSQLKLENDNLSIPKVKPIRGQMVSFHTAKRLFNHVIYSPRGYIVPRKQGRILAGATVEDVGFEDETTNHGVETLLENAREISPSLANLSVDEKWSGLRPFASDGLPIIGNVANVENLFVATAHYRNGILLAPMTARILADKILNGLESAYLRHWSPNHLTSKKAN